MHELDKKIGRRDNAYYRGEYLLHIYKCKNDFYLDLPCTLKNYQKHSIAREVALLIHGVLDYVSSRHFGKNFDFYIMKIF